MIGPVCRRGIAGVVAECMAAMLGAELDGCIAVAAERSVVAESGIGSSVLTAEAGSSSSLAALSSQNCFSLSSALTIRSHVIRSNGLTESACGRMSVYAGGVGVSTTSKSPDLVDPDDDEPRQNRQCSVLDESDELTLGAACVERCPSGRWVSVLSIRSALRPNAGVLLAVDALVSCEATEGRLRLTGVA